jgi:hypothetical protein
MVGQGTRLREPLRARIPYSAMPSFIDSGSPHSDRDRSWRCPASKPFRSWCCSEGRRHLAGALDELLERVLGASELSNRGNGVEGRSDRATSCMSCAR